MWCQESDGGDRTLTLQRMLNPNGNNRILDERICADHVNPLAALIGGDIANGSPHKLQCGGRILAAAITDDPGNLVGQIQILDLLAKDSQGLFETDRGKIPCIEPTAVQAASRPLLNARSTCISSGLSGSPIFCLIKLAVSVTLCDAFPRN
jgi:hypothetical protein